jgi:hypothetical protein
MIKKCVPCFNKGTLKIYPIEKQICSICFSNSKKLFNYPCDVCTKDSWFICNHCLNKCKELSKKCPVCRTEIIELGLDIYPKSIEINLNINNQENKYNKMFRYLSRCCYMSNIIFHITAYSIGCIFIGMIFPTMICYGNCNEQNIICPLAGLFCGIMFSLLILMFFRSKNEINGIIRCFVGVTGALVFVFTISITGELYIDVHSFLWLIIVLPICLCISQRSI